MQDAKRVASALIFDLDGVLTHTDDYHYQAWQKLAQEEDLPFDASYKDRFRGMTRRQSVEILLAGREKPEAVVEAYMARKHAYFLELVVNITPANLLHGVGELLHEAKAQKIPVGLASSSRNARDVCERLGVLAMFDAVCDGYSPVPPKPAPDIFLMVSNLLGVAPQESIVFEDSSAGIAGAREGGFWAVGIGDISTVGQAHRVYTTLEGVDLNQLALPL